jgi:hypothetical protein
MHPLTRAAALLRSSVVVADITVWVREATAAELGDYNEQQKTDRDGALAKLLKACVTDEEGAPILDDADAAAWARKSAIAFPVVSEILTLGQKKIEIPKVDSAKKRDLPTA